MMANLNTTNDEKITEVFMSRDGKGWVFVEGETDLLFFRSHLNSYLIKIDFANSKTNVIEILKAFHEYKEIVIGIVDKDYDDHLLVENGVQNLVHTDARDLENMLFRSDVLQRVMEEFASKAKSPIDGKGRIDVIKIRSVIYESTIKIGKVRIYSQVNNLNLTFKNLNYEKFICKKNCKIFRG